MKKIIDECYELWLVPNGWREDFRRGITSGCASFGDAPTLEALMARYAELAGVNFDRLNPDEDFANNNERERERDAEIARASENFSLEWEDDLKFVMARKVRLYEDGEVEVVEVLS